MKNIEENTFKICPPPPRKSSTGRVPTKQPILKHRLFCHAELASETYRFLGQIKRIFTYIMRCRNKFEMIPTFKPKTAFTLAEVLITLIIIGVIAALTVPNLMHQYRMHVRRTQLKKAYSILTNVIKKHKADNAIDDYVVFLKDKSSSSDTYAANRIQTYLLLKDYIKDTYDCPYDSKVQECSRVNEIYGWKPNSFDGKQSWWFGETQGVVLAGGMAYAREWIYNSNVQIHVDINGYSKPNRYGMDMFIFNVSRDGKITPASHETGQGGCKDTSDHWGGGGCTYKALYTEEYWKNPLIK